MFRALAVRHSLWRRDNAWKVSFRNPLQWPIYIIYSVDKTKRSCHVQTSLNLNVTTTIVVHQSLVSDVRNPKGRWLCKKMSISLHWSQNKTFMGINVSFPRRLSRCWSCSPFESISLKFTLCYHSSRRRSQLRTKELTRTHENGIPDTFVLFK